MISKFFTRSKNEKLEIDNSKLTLNELNKKLKEETNEVEAAIENKDRDNLLEELLDTIQVSANMIEKIIFDDRELENKIKEHNEKLEGRGWDKSNEVILITSKNRRKGI
ncbi:hypothetical protein [Clostridium ihumii]|uniref:hypothetical protein n=1 Tax=Clostridium ihumii TaxID=1470356 RepID=UPI0006881596|nr:hypothetical protein [Clostridium ihumii]